MANEPFNCRRGSFSPAARGRGYLLVGHHREAILPSPKRKCGVIYPSFFANVAGATYFVILNLFMQNKPNFLKNRVNVSYGNTEGYENEHRFLAQNSQSQFWPTVSSCKLEDYENEPPFLA